MSAHLEAPIRPGRTGRPVEAVEKTHSAMRVLLTERPIAELTVEMVAEHAGVHRSTIHRRWRDLETLLAEVLDRVSVVRVPAPDTGSLEGDVEAIIRGYARHFGTDLGKAINRALINSGHGEDGQMARWMRSHATEQRRAFETVARRARERGELESDDDFMFAIEVAVGMLLSRSLLSGGSLGDDLTDRLLAIVGDELQRSATRRRAMTGPAESM